MKIDGKLIASQIKEDLKVQVEKLISNGISPQLAVIYVGDDPSSAAYIRQKEKVGTEIGVKVNVIKIQSLKDTKLQKSEIIELLDKLNKDPDIHGIIIQRPVPLTFSKEELDLMVIPEKDVDAFHPQTLVQPPIAEAVIKILEWVKNELDSNVIARSEATKQSRPNIKNDNIIEWLNKQIIVVIGRGDTAGKPIAETLIKSGVNITVAHSKTENIDKLCRNAGIIISCVGKPNVVRRDMVTDKSILIGVGLHQEEGKLKTDYNLEEMAEIVSYWTPVPGGVGPVNVACLFENLIVLTSGIRKEQSYFSSN